MSDTIISIYKNADNDLGYEKQYIDPDDYDNRDEGWHRTQAAAIGDGPDRTLADLTKQGLADYAKDNFGATLDMTQVKADLLAEVEALVEANKEE